MHGEITLNLQKVETLWEEDDASVQTRGLETVCPQAMRGRGHFTVSKLRTRSRFGKLWEIQVVWSEKMWVGHVTRDEPERSSLVR